MNKQNGFTLVEIAIVMVIIGLLLGGVLKGQEIITNAKIKNLENDFSGVTAAIYSYQDRYRALPGDDGRAQARFGITETSSADKIGNGNIEGDFNSTTETDESNLLWAHLRSAGLVDGDASNNALPVNSFSGITGVSSDKVLDIAEGRTYIGFSKIPNSISIILESRSDDENPNTGSIRADNGGGASAAKDSDNSYYSDDDKEAIRNMYFIL
ncbi:MAG: prepilin-type N-terminal cleavage/methylation domain-containing protein [Candidatus Marithrix sp.]